MIFKNLKKGAVVYNARINEVYLIIDISPITDGGLCLVTESSTGGAFSFLSEDEACCKLGEHMIVAGSL